jgi:hypothetical protein
MTRQAVHFSGTILWFSGFSLHGSFNVAREGTPPQDVEQQNICTEMPNACHLYFIARVRGFSSKKYDRTATVTLDDTESTLGRAATIL